MKLEKPIEISRAKLVLLQSLIMKMMVYKECLVVMNKFSHEIQSKEKKKGFPWNRKVVVEEQILITYFSIWGFHPEKKFWGIFDSEDAIHYFITFAPLKTMRDKFLTMKDALDNLGWEISRKENISVLEETFNID